ncbi:hypothetical protein BDN72DRAFT_959372 [Pluteus cervinus]|uniref:Uncharacterized protein n=1 Tax=Pluteus cervinus TaxID=181527 RepID=A0ACD3AVR1_9AGAR|nr:hypothetical protein BDN72DRAFT_959372 [Pluteus cervinus]
MPTLGQFSARITVNDSTLPEYGVEIDEGTATVSCWIPSEEEQEFVVRWKDSDNKFDLSGLVKVDGVNVGGRTYKHRPKRRVAECKRRLVRTSTTSGRPLVFSKVELTEDDRYLDHSLSKQFGEIRIILTHVKLEGHLPGLAPGNNSIPSDAIKLHERTKKVLGHCVATGNETVYREKRPRDYAVVRKLATFIFKYRPLALLQAEGIAPLQTRALSTTLSTQSGDNTGTSSSATLARITALERELRSLKDSVERPAKRAKLEVKPEPRPSVPRHLGTFDLTANLRMSLSADVTAFRRAVSAYSRSLLFGLVLLLNFAMPALGKFSAWIEVDEEHLSEFGSEISDDNSTITCWVPSEEGKEFAIYWRDSNLQYTLDGEVTVDGQSCGGEIARLTEEGDVTRSLDGVMTGPSTSRALVFSKINLTDDDRYLQDTSVAEKLGEIKLVLGEAVVTGQATWNDESTHFSDDMKVHERSKKGIGHRVSLGEEVNCPASNAIFVDTIRRVATFIFRYRPLAILQANGIAPLARSIKRKASTPEEISDDDEVDQATATEIEALKARLQALKGRQRKRVKSEVKAESSSGLKNMGVIDLTDLD